MTNFFKNLTSSLLIFIILASGGCNAMQADRIKLDLKKEEDSLTLNIVNNTSQSIRVWELWNSWGWNTVSLQLQPEGNESKILLTRRKDAEWTKNYPSFIEIAPGEEQELILDMKDGWWEANGNLSSLESKVIQVRAILEISSTPEAEENNIFIGKIESEWIESHPPHTWLLPQP